MPVLAGIYAVLFRKAGVIPNLWYIVSHIKLGPIVHLIKVLSNQGVDLDALPKDPIQRAQRIGFVRQTSQKVENRTASLTREACGEVWIPSKPDRPY